MNQSPLFGAIPGREPVRFHPDFASWRQQARRLLHDDRHPDSVWWQPDPTCARSTEPSSHPRSSHSGRTLSVPRAFHVQAGLAACHRTGDRWALLYNLLWRLTHGERYLLDLAGDPDVRRLRNCAKSVRRDLHKMKAFVRFRMADQRYVAWFEPDHLIVEVASGFFRRRFAAMHWSILTPDACAHWEGDGEVWFTEGASRAAAPDSDDFEDAWRSYYRSIFNPARLNISAMCAEMPKKYWKNLPEAIEIPELVRHAENRVLRMMAEPQPREELHCGPRPLTPDTLLAREHAAAPAHSLAALRLAAMNCRDCALWEPATQTVFGEGSERARVMLVGEQPGDQEDLAGRPFVGPAGRVLDRALAAAGIDRGDVYVTNAVKHFRFRPVGKRRLHDRPREGDIDACARWLDAEIERVQPMLVVCLGATAARSRLQLRGTLEAHRGRLIERDGRQYLVTVHPAHLLRLQSRAAAAAAFERFVDDLRLAANAADAPQAAGSANHSLSFW